MNISRSLIAGRAHWAKRLGLVYLNNAKVACSTIKKSLWLAVDDLDGAQSYTGNPNDRGAGPFSRNLGDLKEGGDFEQFLEASFFSVVRNPYARVLSSYLDKVKRGAGDRFFWSKFTAYFGVPDDADLSFSGFLRLIQVEEPTALDWHLCPQSVNLLHPVGPLDFIGRLEEMDGLAEWLSMQGVTVRSHIRHARNAGSLIEQFYGPEEIDIVRRFFRSDFELYGYSDDPSKMHPVRQISPDPGRAGLRRLLTGGC